MSNENEYFNALIRISELEGKESGLAPGIARAALAEANWVAVDWGAEMFGLLEERPLAKVLQFPKLVDDDLDS